MNDFLLNKEYDFLRINPYLNNNICLLGYGGSHAYGTNTADSDIDIRGFYMDNRREVTLGKINDQVIDEATDTTIYGFRKLIELLGGCNPNVIEILGLREQDYLYKNIVGEDILANKDMFLSQKAFYTFGGYARQQLWRLKQMSLNEVDAQTKMNHVCQTLDGMIYDIKRRYNLGDGAIKVRPRDKIELDVFINNIGLDELGAIIGELRQCVKSYDKSGRRNDYAIVHKKINKHAMHLVRLYLMGIDILNGEIVTYREKEHDLLMDIRNGKYYDKGMTKEFYEIVDDLEARFSEAARKTQLPKEPDWKRIEEFVIKWGA